ncbi:MAG TPA: hypothetical protein VFI06_09615 [Chitinophagaceae bacterium]|nr:hypothetical protein [Chitinophagaceae bacterium]
MNYEKCALIIPSTVYVSAPYTFLTDSQERQRQYAEAISFFIRETPLVKIIVCDNSGFKYPVSLQHLAVIHKKELELLSFRGNSELVAEYGKGYGEGEIMQFVLSNSSLIRTVEGFLKVTGRLKLLNTEKLLRKCDNRENYFMPVSLLRPRFMMPAAARHCVDTRVYYTTREFFTNVLLNAYREVRDKNTFFLEHAYHRAIAASGIKVKCFPVAPEISGMSGSNGFMMKKRGMVKKMLIRIASGMGYIRPI